MPTVQLSLNKGGEVINLSKYKAKITIFEKGFRVKRNKFAIGVEFGTRETENREYLMVVIEHSLSHK